MFYVYTSAHPKGFDCIRQKGTEDELYIERELVSNVIKFTL